MGDLQLKVFLHRYLIRQINISIIHLKLVYNFINYQKIKLESNQFYLAWEILIS